MPSTTVDDIMKIAQGFNGWITRPSQVLTALLAYCDWLSSRWSLVGRWGNRSMGQSRS